MGGFFVRRLLLGFLAFLMLAAALASAPWAMGLLPIRTKAFLKRRPLEWSGILTIAVVPAWGSEGFTAWLSARAREFERENPGVLLSVREMNVAAYLSHKEKRDLPDAVILPAYVELGPDEVFLPLAGFLPARQEALLAGQRAGRQYGLPLALGSYALMGNVPKMDALQLTRTSGGEEILAGMKKSGRGVGCPILPFVHAEEMLKRVGWLREAPVQYVVREKAWPDFALEEKTLLFVASQREVRRMQKLQGAGRCFETTLLLPETPYTDQMLLYSLVRSGFSGHGADAKQRQKELAAFGAYLLSEEAQKLLGGAWVFSPREDLSLYESGPMAELERTLAGEVEIPNAYQKWQG
jgi:hypothetical protein